MKREFLKGLELSDEVIDKIMAEHGRSITEVKGNAQTLESENNDLKQKVATYETKIADLEKLDGDKQKVQQELDDLKQKLADDETKRKVEKDDEILTNNIKSVFGDKKFVNEYTQNALIGDIKLALKDTNNVGKSAKELFEELTKDKEGIFANPNQVVNTGEPGEVNKNLTEEAKNRELIGLPKQEDTK